MTDINEVLIRALEELAAGNPEAHQLMVHKIEEGFFGTSQPRNSMQHLADQLLNTVLVQEGEDAH